MEAPTSVHGMVGETPSTRSIVVGVVSGKSASARTSGPVTSVATTEKRMNGMAAKKPRKPEYCWASRLPGAMAPMAAKMAP